MALNINRLSARRVTTIKQQGRYADGGGLYLQVSPVGTKAWLFRFTLDGKARQMGLGSIHTISLAEAREKARDCRQLLLDRIDPIENRKAERTRRKQKSAKVVTFRECAESYIKAHSSGWRNIKHAAQWQNTLKTYAFPVLGELAVQDVDTGLVLKVLEPIWANKTETAGRIRGRIESILDWATVREYRAGENPARWRGHLDQLLPARSKVRQVRHHPALPYDQIGVFMEKLRGQEPITARGLEFLILTATRTDQVIGARWDEIDSVNAMWIVPRDRTKNGREHRIPLSPAALMIVEGMSEARLGEFIFPGQHPGRPLSNMAFLQLLKRMGRNDLTVHGFRSTFRDWAAERTNCPVEVAEMALGHTVGNKVEAAYRRGDLLDKRRRVMNDWCDYCALLPSDTKGQNVVSLR